jgi:hypothetical protein
MPEVLIKYKHKKSLAVLEDLSKHLDFKVIKLEKGKKVDDDDDLSTPLMKQIEEGLKEVKLVMEGKLKPVSLEELLNEE